MGLETVGTVRIGRVTAETTLHDLIGDPQLGLGHLLGHADLHVANMIRALGLLPMTA